MIKNVALAIVLLLNVFSIIFNVSMIGTLSWIQGADDQNLRGISVLDYIDRNVQPLNFSTRGNAYLSQTDGQVSAYFNKSGPKNRSCACEWKLRRTMAAPENLVPRIRTLEVSEVYLLNSRMSLRYGLHAVNLA